MITPGPKDITAAPRFSFDEVRMLGGDDSPPVSVTLGGAFSTISESDTARPPIRFIRAAGEDPSTQSAEPGAEPGWESPSLLQVTPSRASTLDEGWMAPQQQPPGAAVSPQVTFPGPASSPPTPVLSCGPSLGQSDEDVAGDLAAHPTFSRFGSSRMYSFRGGNAFTSLAQDAHVPTKTRSEQIPRYGRRDADDSDDDEENSSLPRRSRSTLAQQEAAVVTIQKHVRARGALREARRRHQWQLFNHLDAEEDREMLNVATFLQKIKALDDSKFTQAMEDRGGDGQLDDALQVDTITIFGGDCAAGLEYKLPKGPVTVESALCIVEALRQGGKLSHRSLHRILRGFFAVVKDRPNVCSVTVPRGGSVTIVGDIHGQLADLFTIFRECGYPSDTNRFIFNGDFVDRGPQGVEVVIILFAFATVYPDSVLLNRGNHEDYFVTCAYGFQQEVRNKYDELTFMMFIECFHHLPIAAIIEGKVFVVHGGLFHREGVTIDELQQIPRSKFVPQCNEENLATAGGRRQEELLDLMRDCLWSDPWEGQGCEPNRRGAGVLFDEERCREFLDRNGLDMVFRSHECVPEGFLRIFPDQDDGRLCTVFSASNYGLSGNKAAVVMLSHETGPESHAVNPWGNGRPLYFEVVTFESQECVEENLLAKNELTINGLVLRKKTALRAAFQEIDVEGRGTVSKSDWADTMARVVGVQAQWLLLLPVVAKAEHISGESYDLVNYRAFLDDCQLAFNRLTDQDQGTDAFFAALYSNKERLRGVFRYFDADGDGVISHQDFKKGCEHINAQLPPDQHIVGVYRMLEAMSLSKGSGSTGVDINEFFEVFRLAESSWDRTLSEASS